MSNFANIQPITMSATNLFKYLSLMTPFLIGFFMLMLSIFNNTIAKGLIFLIGGVLVTFINYILKNILREKQSPLASPFCNILPQPFTVKKTEEIYSSPGLSTTVIAFTAAYLIFPMTINNENNPALIVFLLGLLGINGATEYHMSCTSIAGVILGIVVGGLFGMLYYGILAGSGNKQLAYFSELQSNSTQCRKPSNQKFKCVTYKRGERVKMW
tara:strand:+ start:3412 stop:4053 length:642 start_codon:yes stop_codon:yes gene_type:complete